MVEPKYYRDVGGFGSGTVVMLHDRASRTYRVEMDGGNHVFGSFEYGPTRDSQFSRDEARKLAQLTLDVAVTTLRSVGNGKL